MATSPDSSENHPQLPMFSLEERPVNRSPLPVYEAGLPTLAETLHWPTWRWLAFCDRDGSCGRMSLESSAPTGETPSDASYAGWSRSGMASAGECWTLNTSTYPSAARVCSLSAVLAATRDVPRRYYLSRKACAGIIRRAAKRERELPPALMAALEAVARTTTTPEGAG